MKKLSALGLVVVMALSMVACGNNSGKANSGEEQTDTSRTQLYVFNFAGGYGSDWLVALKERYEELHKDDVYEEGKKGIQIVINSVKTNADSMASQILNNKEEVYFTEYANYYTLLNAGVLGDITEAVTTDISVYGDKEGTTIVDKMTDEQKEFYAVDENGETHYYGVPHYATYTGITYNVDLFDTENYYFADGVTAAEELEEYFIANSDDKKSAGPDGQYGTYDDGLPATFKEFFLLCDYIAERGHMPINWQGASYNNYLSRFLTSVEANVDGAEQMKLNYTMNGVATNLGKATANGFVKDSSNTAINADNGYELHRQAGKYYALEFINTIISNGDSYLNPLSFNSGYSHMNAQEDFLYAGNDGGATQPIAMLVDGVWWQSEATATFDTMSGTMGEEYSKKNRNFAFMPLPKESESNLGKNVMVDHGYSLCFMKSNIEEWKKPIALDFIKFANSDASLAEYTTITNTTKALNYPLTDEQMKELSPYGRSLVELQQNSDIVYPFSKSSAYVNNAGRFNPIEMWKSQVGGTAYEFPYSHFNTGAVTFVDYFNGMKDSYQSDWYARAK